MFSNCTTYFSAALKCNEALGTKPTVPSKTEFYCIEFKYFMNKHL